MSFSTTNTNKKYQRFHQSEHYFKTDHLKDDLKGRSVRGGAVTLAAQVCKFVLQMGSTMALARLLTPADFGLVAMVFAVTGFVGMFKDAGLSMATIQRDEITHDQISVLFWINVCISTCLMLFTLALAPAIAWFYGEPRLVWITVAYAGTYIFGGMTIQHQALLRRQMHFHILAGIELAAMTVGIISATVTAYFTKSYFSLVLMPAASAAFNALLVWVFCNWRPSWPRRNTGVRPMLKFGANMLASSVLWYVSQNIYDVLIGKILGAEFLGFFTKAYHLMLVLIRKVNNPLYSVTYPALSALQNSPKEFRAYYRKAIGMMAFVSMPCSVLFFVAAKHIVLIMLGDQWLYCISVCRALGPAAFLGAIGLSIACVIIPIGKPDREWKLKGISVTIHFIALIIGLKWGIIGAAVAMSITEILFFIPSHIYAFRGTPVKLSDLISSIWQVALASIAAGAIIYFFILKMQYIDEQAVVGFIILSLLFLLLYLGTLIMLPGGKNKVKALINAVRALKK